MRENIASVRTQTPVLGKLARMRQMQGRASRLEMGLAAFSERIAKRVTKRAMGQWRRFSLEYIMDEEKDAQAPQRGDIYNNVELDVLISLRAGEGGQRTERELLQQRIESSIERRLTLLQPEILMRKYDIHAPAHMQMHLHPAQAGERAAVRTAQRQAERPEQSAMHAAGSAAVLMEKALLRERERTQTMRQQSVETLRQYVRENRLFREKPAQAQAGQTRVIQTETREVGRVEEKETLLRRMQQVLTREKETEHIVRQPVHSTEVRQFAQTQMVRALGDVIANESTEMRRAGDVVRQMQGINRPMHSIIREAPAGARYAERMLAPGERVREGAQRMGATAQPAKESENERLAQQIRMRSRLGYEQLTHAESGAAASGEAERPAPQRTAETEVRRPTQQRASALWNVLERTTERLLESVTRISALPGTEEYVTERRRETARRAARKDASQAQQTLLREIEQRNQFGYETLVHEAGAQKAETVRQVSERSTERMLRSVERHSDGRDGEVGRAGMDGRRGSNGAAGRDGRNAEQLRDTVRNIGEIRSAGRVERMEAQRTLLREIERRNQFGYETQVQETGEQSAEALREMPEGMHGETISETEREILRQQQMLREREIRTERRQRAQVMRQVLERSTEHMLHSVEQVTGAEQSPEAQRGETQAQQTLLRQIEQRNRFGYETLVHETGAQKVEAPESAQSEIIHETEREHRAQMLRQVLERSTERMLRSVERHNDGRDGEAGRAGMDGRRGSAGAGTDGRNAERLRDTVRNVGEIRRAGSAERMEAQRTLLRQIEQRNRFGYETLVHETGAQMVEAPESAQSEIIHETEREILRERELRTQREYRAQMLRQVLERSTERMLRSVERRYDGRDGDAGRAGMDGRRGSAGAAGTDGRNAERLRDTVRNIGEIRRAGSAERMEAQRTLLRQIEQRNRFGYETLVHETGAQKVEAQESAQSEVIHETEREILRERELRTQREHRAQMLRQVLERSTERMLRSVEQVTGTAQSPGTQRGAAQAQQTLLRQIEERNRFGYETLVHEGGAQSADVPRGRIEPVHAEQNGYAQREWLREHRTQVMRQVLERSAEHMLRSVEHTTLQRGGDAGRAGMNGEDGRSGMRGAGGSRGMRGTRGLSGERGAGGRNGRAGENAQGHTEVSLIRNVYGQAAQPVSEKERLMRQIELRAQFGYETLVYEGADHAQQSGQEPLQATAAEQRTERILRSEKERMQVIRSVLERTTERLLGSVQRMGLATESAEGAAAESRTPGRAAAVGRSAMQSMQRGAQEVQRQSSPMVRGAYGAQQAGQDAAQQLEQQVRLRRRFGYEELSYAAEGAQDVQSEMTQMQPVQRTMTRADAHASAQTIRNVMQRAVQAAARREAMLTRPKTFEAMESVMQAPKTYARPLKTAVEGQAGMTLLMKQKNAQAPRSTLEMIAMQGEGTSPLRSSILTQPAEIVMFVPPTTMSMYGAAPPKVGNLSWEETPKAEDRSSAQAAVRLMQKAQQKFGNAARYRPPEMVMKEQGDATGKLASQQMGQPANINQQMRARKSVVKESSAQELTAAEITRIVDRVYDKIERKIATEYRRRGR